jgi:CO/xanthine dehydrogenase FAD-binding subunit
MTAHAPAGLAKTEMLRPRALGDACALLARARADGKRVTLLAGGTDLVVDRHLMPLEKATEIDVVIDLMAIPELACVREETGDDGQKRLVLGGGVTYWQLRTDPRVVRAVPVLAEMAKDVGAVQIQTRGTLAGNIVTASPAADGVAVLMALDAVVTLAGAGGSRRVLLEDFFTGYRKTVLAEDEILSEIELRVPSALRPRAYVRWRKVGTRLAQAISKVALASAIEQDGEVITRARFAMASVAPVTHPLRGVRAFLEGKRISEVDRASLDLTVEREIKPIDDVRSTGEYRLHVAKALVWRALSG